MCPNNVLYSSIIKLIEKKNIMSRYEEITLFQNCQNCLFFYMLGSRRSSCRCQFDNS